MNNPTVNVIAKDFQILGEILHLIDDLPVTIKPGTLRIEYGKKPILATFDLGMVNLELSLEYPDTLGATKGKFRFHTKTSAERKAQDAISNWVARSDAEIWLEDGRRYEPASPNSSREDRQQGKPQDNTEFRCIKIDLAGGRIHAAIKGFPGTHSIIFSERCRVVTGQLAEKLMTVEWKNLETADRNYVLTLEEGALFNILHQMLSLIKDIRNHDTDMMTREGENSDDQ